MRSTGINREGELRGQLANPGSPGKMTVKTECVYIYRISSVLNYSTQNTAALMASLTYCVARKSLII